MASEVHGKSAYNRIGDGRGKLNILFCTHAHSIPISKNELSAVQGHPQQTGIPTYFD